MAIRSATSVKATFETGDKPTESQFADFVDTSIRVPLVAIATAAEGGATGLIEIVSTASATLRSLGAFGVIIVDAATTASAQGHLGAGTVGTLLLEAVTTASALGHIDGQADLDVPSQAEAEAGTATTERVWTSQRVSQAAAQHVITQAIQSAIEAETDQDTYIPPDLLKHNPGIAKFWLRFDGSDAGPITPAVSFNVVDVTDNGTGLYTVNIDTDFSTANFSVFALARDVANNGAIIQSEGTPTAGTQQIEVTNRTGTAIDPLIMYAGGFGDQ